MNYEEEIIKLQKQYASLSKSFLQAQKNQVPITGKTDSAMSTADSALSMAEAITPYTETKTAYISDTFVEFDNVPSGNITIGTNAPLDYSYKKEGSLVIVEFDPLEEVIDITISVL